MSEPILVLIWNEDQQMYISRDGKCMLSATWEDEREIKWATDGGYIDVKLIKENEDE